MPSISAAILRPTTAGYTPLSPYTDDAATIANNLLCPRYAESDPTSAPPSPASIESFDVLDSIPWRRSYIFLDSTSGQGSTYDVVRKRWRKNRAHIIMISLLFALLVAGCTIGGYLAIKHEREKLRTSCHNRNGGDKCEQLPWAKCVARNGLGYCEGIM